MLGHIFTSLRCSMEARFVQFVLVIRGRMVFNKAVADSIITVMLIMDDPVQPC